MNKRLKWLHERQELLKKSHEWTEHGDLFKCTKCGKITGNPTVEDSECKGQYINFK